MKNSKFKKSILALAVSGLPVASYALEDISLSEDDFLGENIVYSSSVTRLKQQVKNIPASVTIITRDMIEASSATTPVELMRLVPGFQVGCLHANDCTVTYHGLSNEHNTRLHVMLNGRSVYEPMFGGTLWYTLPITIDDIESIEVVRGPNASAYGANSFSGVVNIKTFSAATPGNDEVSYTYGHQRDLHRLNLRQSGEADGLTYTLSAGVETNNGFDNSYLDNNDPDPSKVPAADEVVANYNDGLSALHLDFNFEKIDNAGAKHLLEAGLKVGDLGVGYEGLESFGIPEAQMSLLTFFENYKYIYSTTLLESKKISINHSYTRQINKSFNADGGSGGNHSTSPASFDPLFGIDGDHLIYLDNSLNSQVLNAEYEHQRIFSPEIQTVWGAGFRFDYAESDNYFNGNSSQDRFSSRVFGHIEWSASKNVTVNVGGLIEKYDSLDFLFSPRIAANYHLNSFNTLRANLSRAYRVPSLYDLNANYLIYEADKVATHDFDTVGNPELEAERIDSIEIGYLGQFFEDKLTVDIRLAWEEITDVIETRKTVGGKRNPNIPRWWTLNYGESDTESAEIDIFYKPTKSTFFKVSSAYANTYGYRANQYNAYSNIVDPAEIRYEAYKYTPQLTHSALVSHTFDNDFSVSAQYAFVEAYLTGGGGDSLEALESVDLKLRKSFKIDQRPVEFSAIIKNIADAEYEDFANENLVGLEAYVGIKVGL